MREAENGNEGLVQASVWDPKKKKKIHEETIIRKSESELSKHPPKITMRGGHPTLYSIM